MVTDGGAREEENLIAHWGRPHRVFPPVKVRINKGLGEEKSDQEHLQREVFSPPTELLTFLVTKSRDIPPAEGKVPDTQLST